jgi:hypothetical protein
MKKIKDLMLLDLTEDIKDVIDVEQQTEDELQFEIENYIVTNKIAEHFSDLINLYQSNIKETGVWLSGFYGSGKSYFGKMFGYVLENPSVNGTPFMERFIQRLAGIPKQSLLENAARRLNIYDTKVVFLDIAKQNTKNGFAWTLFKNFLRTMGFLDDVFGYWEYGLYLDGKYDQFLSDVQRITGSSWQELRKNPVNVSKTVRKVLTDTAYTLDEYKEGKAYLDQRITSYDAAKFREELSHYLDKHPNQRIVFIVDEVSEAVSQKKIDLLELEGISEALSDISQGKVWTIAIAQEKLDDVISNANVSVRELSKVIDRFKARINLSSEEVDTVIRKRLLLKNEKAGEQLQQYYSDHSGLVMDSTSLNARFPTKSDNEDDFAIYYPFHKYQFELLQNFLFSVHQKAKTGGTERGMIIATYTILKAIKDENLYAFVTAENLADGGKKVVDGELERKFAQADKVLKKAKSSIDGVNLLKTIYFLNESELVTATSENITKLSLTNLDDYYAKKPKVEEALAALCDANLLLEKNNVYKITSDLEQKLIDEMKGVNVEFHYKRRDLITLIKEQPFIKDISKCTFEGSPYNFHVISAQGDELGYSTNKNIKIQVASPYTVELESRDDYIEKIKFETQSNTELATLIPAMDDFLEIDKLIEEIYRYGVLEDRYKNDDDEKIRGIIKDFSVNKTNRSTTLNRLIENSYKAGTIVCHFEEHALTPDNFVKVVQNIQEKIISNTYTDRLPQQLSEDIGPRILKEPASSKLKSYFSGTEFDFFDSDGNFTGERLRVVEKIVANTCSIFVDGEELEKRFSIPPYGYSYGTVLTVLAVLLRAGRLSVKHGGKTLYDYKNEDARNLFSKSREFKKASFKAITSSLTHHQKQQVVDNLKKLKANEILNRDFGYSTNDIELVTIIGKLSDHFIQKVEELKKIIAEFNDYFPKAQSNMESLQPYDIKITDSNYKSKAEEFLGGFDQFSEAIEHIQNIISFIENNLSRVKKYHDFIVNIVRELEKLGGTYQGNLIFKLQEDFRNKFDESVINNYSKLEKIYQNIKDEYHRLIKDEHDLMAKNHADLKLYKDIIPELDSIITYAQKHICNDLRIEYEISCQSCHFSLNEIIASNQNVGIRLNEVDTIRTRIEYPDTGGRRQQPKRVNIKSKKGEFTALQYRKILKERLDQIRPLNDDDIIIVD